MRRYLLAQLGLIFMLVQILAPTTAFAADKTIHAYSSVDALATGDEFLLWDVSTSTTKKATIADILAGNAATATKTATPRAIYGNNFDGSAALTQVIASTYGGTGNGFAKFSGPTTTEKTFTLPDASSTIMVGSLGATANVIPAASGTGGATLAATSGSTSYLFNTTGLLQFGGTSSSSSALKDNGAVLEVRKADDSGYTGMAMTSAKFYRLTSENIIIDPSSGYISLYAGDTNHLPSVRFTDTANAENGQDAMLSRCGAGCVSFDGSTVGNGLGNWKAGDAGTRPTCDSTQRGRYWHEFGGASTADVISICCKNVSDVYVWATAIGTCS